MGAKDSKPSCISYEDAIKRVTDSELRRIREAFKKSSGAGGTTLSKTTFLQDVLSEGVPPVLAEWLYGACGGTQKGIPFKELLCGLVLLTRGSQEEKIKFLWNVYCNEANTHIIKNDFAKALQIESTYQPIVTTSAATVRGNSQQQQPLQTLSHTSILISLFGQTDRVTFEQFKLWITKHEKATVLSKWLLLESGVNNLSTELETPTFFQSLAGVTHLEEHDIADLEKVFWLLKGSAKTGQLDLESLGPLITPPVPKAALSGVFLAFDENRDGHIDFKELCCGVSAACRGPSVERSKFCFKVFDVDRDGVLNFDEIKEMVNILIFVSKESTNSTNYKNLTVELCLEELYGRIAKPNVTNSTGPFKSINNIEPFSFTQEDFMMWSVQSSLNLVQPFLDLLFEVCHVVLGLRPQCKHLQYDIVNGWLAREKGRGYRIGQFWYLVSGDWYQNWKQYTQSASSSPCSFCKSTPNYNNQRGGNNGAGIGFDEAMVCDESFTSNSTEFMGDLLGTTDSSSLGSGSSGISYGRQVNGPPGFIDNSNLIAPNDLKNIQTLTGEGGRLKRDLILAEHRDYELVPESLWKALSQWYRGPLPLPRQVIQPPNAVDVELELYPLNLQILRHQNPSPVAQTVSTWGAVAGGYGAVTTAGSYTTANSSMSGNNSVNSAVLQPPKRYLAYTAAFSRLATVKQVGEFLCQRLKLKLEDIRLWHIYNSASDVPCLLEEENLTLQELMIADNDQILLEIRNKDLTWPEELGSLALTQSTGIGHQDRRATLASIQSVHAPGATGLHNLGNTCFMNAALQVLFNTQPLTQYFKQDMHFYELNTTNKLGTKGQLAIRYSELLKEVWTASTRSVAPLKLRFCMTKHAPQFAGGGQHDSQELLEWLLDGLHEDLNRVTEKPYSELKDSDGRADSVVAAEAWQQHHARNQSIVIDLFHGQLKSKVSCLGCGRDSVRFDPFSLLSLPLPVENYTYCEVLVILLDGSVPIKYGLRLNSESKYIDFKRELSNICQIDAGLMLVCELSNSQIRCSLPDQQKLKVSTATELFVYEIPKGGFFRARAGTDISMNIENGLKDIQRNPALLIPSSDQHQLTTTSIQSTSTTLSSTDEQINCNGLSTSLMQPLTTASTSTKNAKITNNNSRSTSKQTSELSTSPDSTFIQANSTNLRKSSTGAVELLNFKDTSIKESLLVTKNNATNTTDQLKNIFENGIKHNNYDGHDDRIENEQSSSVEGFENTDDRIMKTMQQYKKFDCDNHVHDADGERIYSLNLNSNNSKKTNINCQCDKSIIDDDEDDVGVPFNDLINSNCCYDDCSTSAINANNCHNIHDERPAGGYLIAVHRKLSRQDTYFLSYHKTRPSLFGVPLLIPCYKNGTNKDLYCAVWVQVARLLSPLPPTPPDQSNHATDCDDSLGYEFPFTLRAVSEGGRLCALCPWSKFCRGCEIPCNDDPLLNGNLSSSNNSSNASTPKLSSRDTSTTTTTTTLPKNNSFIIRHNSDISFGEPPNTSAIHIAIDWDPTALHLRYQSTRERVWTEHESVSICRKQQTEPVDLDHCLRAFTTEEKLEEWYHCAHCKGKKPATKKLQIWKLPPILIIHLKRFNFVNNKWVKSQKVVNFPFKNFDPTPYLASVPQETILRHKELLDHHHQQPQINQHFTPNHANDEQLTKNIIYNEIGNDDEIAEFDRESGRVRTIFKEQEKPIELSTIDDDDNDCDNDNYGINSKVERRGVSSLNANSISKTTTTTTTTTSSKPVAGPHTLERRKRLVSTSLTQTPVIDGEFTDFHNHRLQKGQDPYDLKYQLYAVVSHSGMLNGGHYISYAANPNNSWYCYNDSSCREIPHQPNIDPGSAYLLFYERQGLNYSPYLPKVDGKLIPNGSPVDTDESDNELRKTCVIS